MMANELDELLRDADPALHVASPDAFGPAADALLESVLSKRRRRRVPIGAVAAVVVLLAATVAGATALLTRDVQVDRDILCFESVDPEGLALALPVSDVIEVAACNDLWSTSTLVNPKVAAGEVPNLEGCVLPSGSLGVFPSDDPAICESLDLAVFRDPIDAGDAVATRIRDVLPAGECIPFERGVRLVEALVTGRSDGEWTIQRVGEATGERPCASASVEEGLRLVTLVPIPDLPGS